MWHTLSTLTAAAVLVTMPSKGAESAGVLRPCRIEVMERGTGWPVPLVELRTTHQARFVTDNAGRIAFDLPELMGREVWFDIRGHGYEVPADGFGMRGVRLKPEPGAVLRVEVDRRILARRLGRITGAGRFGESQKLGLSLDRAEFGVLGCDSVQNAVHRGRLFWFWGDTTLARYPLGIFDATGATTSVHPLGSLQPPLELPLEYFTGDYGVPRAVAKMPGEGPTWITACVSLPDKRGVAHLVCSYLKVKPPLEAYEWGLAEWNDRENRFEPLRTVWKKSESIPVPPLLPQGHAFIWKEAQGKELVFFGNPFPSLRCPASYEAWLDSANWQPLQPQRSIRSAQGDVIQPHVGAHSGSVAWHPWLKRWVAVFMQALGKPSAFGELWYAEADAPEGPWGPAVKVLSHDNYTFYNPRVHWEWFSADSPVLLFEGTFTAQFANHPEPVPRQDYNQILYRLDLDDSRLRVARENGK